MSKTTNNPYQKIFTRKALRFLPHHALLHLAIKLHIGLLVNLLNRIAERFFIRAKNVQRFSAEDVENYKKVTLEANLWHGSGRFQHSAYGKSEIDVLSGILKQEGFLPAYDAYGIFSGGEVMQSTSFTYSRMIARAYADMHGKGYLEDSRYGDALTWVAYYYGLFYARMYTFGYAKMRKYYGTWHELTHDEIGHNTWGKKVNKQAEDVWDIFGLGSDIPGNYPVVFGIKQIAFPVKLAKIFRDYEVRSQAIVDFNAISHIEVPAANIKETKTLLAQYNITIPIFSIELGEYVASTQSFSKLLGWKY